jgi:hypothetical protein
MLALELGYKKDPAVELRVLQLQEWCRVWKSLPECDKERTTKAWMRTMPKLSERTTRWCRVKGHMGATIATLFDINWAPIGPSKWMMPDKSAFADLDKASFNEYELAEVVAHSIQEALWETAAGRSDGKGLEKGIDLVVAKRTLAQLSKSGQLAKAGALKVLDHRRAMDAKKDGGGRKTER